MATPRDLLKSEIRAIGLIVYHWSYLEHMTEKLIWAILEVGPTIGRAVTADIQFRARVKMLGKLIDVSHPEMSGVWKDTAKGLRDIEEDRNLTRASCSFRCRRLGRILMQGSPSK